MCVCVYKLPSVEQWKAIKNEFNLRARGKCESYKPKSVPQSRKVMCWPGGYTGRKPLRHFYLLDSFGRSKCRMRGVSRVEGVWQRVLFHLCGVVVVGFQVCSSRLGKTVAELRFWGKDEAG